MTIIIKTMSLTIRFSHLFDPYCVLVGEHLAMLCSKTNYINHKLVLHNSMQPKLEFTQFFKNNFKILIEQLDLK
jgi:hypothetical protein